MLIIRSSQIDTLSQAGFDRFVSKELRRLRKITDNTRTEKNQLHEDWVRKNHQLALTYGMHSEDEHSRFNDITLALGPDFPDKSALAVLNDQELSGSQKLDALEGRIVFGCESADA